MTGHRLDPLLTPRSIALVGASDRAGTVGHGMVAGLKEAGFSGPLYAVNPKYDEVQGVPCFASLTDLPEPVDMAVLGVNSIRIEQQMADAIALGARSCAIFDSCYLDDETDRGLLKRLRAMAAEADMPVCGGNGMGYLNMDAWLPVTIYNAVPKMKRGGNVAFITHSGTVFSEIGLNDPRYACNLIVSCGQEINGTMADYIDYALALPSTRVIALFMETARDPGAMAAALAKARDMGVPVVAMKVGRTDLAAAYAVVHSGAVTGDDDVYQALFDRHDVMRVDTMDDMANLLTLLSNPRDVAEGGLAAVLDSGGEREMLVDLADTAGTPLTELSPATREALRPRLNHALEPVNPLDAWGTADNYEEDFEEYLALMAGDPGTGMVVFCGDMTWSPNVKEGYPKALVEATKRTDKPVGVLINMPTSGFMEVGLEMAEAGLVVLSGTKSGLTAIRHAMTWRDRDSRSHDAGVEAADHAVVARWRERFATDAPSDDDALALLADFGVAAPADAAPTGAHPPLTFSMFHDDQFGPVVTLGFDGALGEAANDRRCVMAPVGPDAARRLIDSLRLRSLLGEDDADVGALAQAFSRFSSAVAALGESLERLDACDIIASPNGCMVGRARLSRR